MTTIKDVAKRAHVAVSTVSYAIKKKKKLKKETVEKILKAVQELNYHPNLTARSLKTKKTNTIGVIVPELSNIFFTEIIKGIEDVTSSNDFTIILCCTYEDSEKETRSLNTLIKKDIDGLIFVGTGKNQSSLIEKINFPIVIVDRKFGKNFISIMVDNKKGGYLATKHLLEKNRSEIYLFTGPLSVNTYFDRMDGYVNALKEYGLDYDESLIIECSIDYDGGYDAVEKLISKNKTMHAIFATNDLIAIGAVKKLLKSGYRIPQDVSIVGYDDIATASIINPELTTIRQPKYVMGKKSAELILDMINGKDVENIHIVLEPELVKREST